MQTDIIEHTDKLPSTIEELIDFVIVSNEAVQGFKAKLNACNKAEVAKEARDQTLRDGRQMSRLHLEAESKLGEILSKIEPKYVGSIKGTHVPQQLKSLPVGIDKKESHYAQEIHKNPRIVEEIFEKKKNDIPTRHDVLKAIQKEKSRKRKQEKTELGKKIVLKDIDFRLGDFKKVLDDIPDNSIDLILTDPPYPEKYLYLYEELSEFASKKLRPSGFCISYAGQYFLPQVINNLGKHLNYYWVFCLYHKGGTAIATGRNIMNRWKPIFIYQKSPILRLKDTLQDYIVSQKSEKNLHDWQQSESGIENFIEYFSKPGDIICDPFVGGGTTLYCANKLKRNCIGAEINEDTYNLAKERLKNE